MDVMEILGTNNEDHEYLTELEFSRLKAMYTVASYL
jgi:hypothetical protein